MNITDRTTTNAVRATFSTLGIDPPKDVADAFARADKLTAKASQLGAQPGDLETAVAAALLADRDPSTDPDVQRVATAQALMANHGLADAITGNGLEGIRSACIAHLDEIVTGWAASFDKAAATLHAAHERIGALALDDTTPIMAKGGDIAEVWAAAKRADGVIDTVLNGWSQLMTLVRVPLNPQHRPLRLAPLTLDQWRTLPAVLKPWDALQAGLTMSLPTIDEYRRRIARLERAQVEETQAEQALGQDALKTFDVEFANRVERQRRAAVAD